MKMLVIIIAAKSLTFSSVRYKTFDLTGLQPLEPRCIACEKGIKLVKHRIVANNLMVEDCK